jgi:hypothetical protein
MNLNKGLDKAYEGKSFKELVDAPVDALSGVTKADAELLEKAFKVRTIGDLGRLKYARLAAAIVASADFEE